MKILKIALIAGVVALAGPAFAQDWSVPPGPEYPETFDNENQANKAFKSYRRGTLFGWLKGNIEWKREKKSYYRQKIRNANQARRKGDITLEEFREIRAAKQEKINSLTKAEREARQAYREAQREARKEARSRVNKD